MAKRVLVVYYSWSCGKTKRIAEKAAAALGADIAAIRTVAPYPDDYDATVDQGKREVDEGFEPDIEPLTKDVADYGVILVGTPTWWYTMAPAVRTWFARTDLAGKTVVPFMTNGGWPGTVIDDMEAACPDAVCELPMQVRFDS